MHQSGIFHLEKDPSQVTSLVLCLTLPFLWGDNLPNIRLNNYNTLSGVVQFLAVLTLLYGSLTVYRVNYFVSAVFVATAAHQMLAEVKAPQSPDQQ